MMKASTGIWYKHMGCLRAAFVFFSAVFLTLQLGGGAHAYAWAFFTGALTAPCPVQYLNKNNKKK